MMRLTYADLVDLSRKTPLNKRCWRKEWGIPLPQVVGGLVFAVAYEIEESLMVPIIIHVLGNLAIFTLSLMS